MQARIEELSSSDDENAVSDPEEQDITDFSASPLVPVTRFGHSNPNSSGKTFTASTPQGRPSAALSDSHASPGPAPRGYDKDLIKNWHCLYPLYFDAGRTRAEGRRVSKELAVANPLAREIVEAVGRLGFQVAFEPGACHPKDWANPGRVRVCMKEEGKAVRGTVDVANKNHLYIKVAKHLQLNPTTNLSPLRLRVPGLPPPTGPLPPPAVPRGWKINDVLPLHSSAVTGGGVSDNLFKDMMSQMGGGGGQQEPEVGQSSGGKAKKEKKKKIKG